MRVVLWAMEEGQKEDTSLSLQLIKFKVYLIEDAESSRSLVAKIMFESTESKLGT